MKQQLMYTGPKELFEWAVGKLRAKLMELNITVEFDLGRLWTF